MSKWSRIIRKIRRRRTGWKLGRAASLLSFVICGSFVVFTVDRSTGSSAIALAANILRTPLNAFDMRSPGERQAGALTQTKQRRFAALNDPRKPHERVLSVVRERPPMGDGDLPDAFTTPIGLPASPAGTMSPFVPNVPVGTSGPGPIASPLSGPPFVPVAPSQPFTDGPGDAGSSGDTVAAVPEPATWAMMLVGFLAVGFALRRPARTTSNRPANSQTNGES